MNGRIDRTFTGHVVVATVVFVILIVSTTRFGAALEFRYSYPPKAEHIEQLPPFIAAYGAVYSYSWVAVVVAILWGVWLLRKQVVSARNTALYVLWMGNAGVFWLLWTLLTLYMMNQSFAFVLSSADS